jgi:hypothetical protein
MRTLVELPSALAGVRVQPPVVFVEPAWEYRHLARPLRADGMPGEAELNTLGAEGWEVTAMLTHARVLHIYLKRQIR